MRLFLTKLSFINDLNLLSHDVVAIHKHGDFSQFAGYETASQLCSYESFKVLLLLNIAIMYSEMLSDVANQ